MRTSCALVGVAAKVAADTAKIRLMRVMTFPQACAWHAFLSRNCTQEPMRLGPCAKLGKAFECRARFKPSCQTVLETPDARPEIRDARAGAAERAPAHRALQPARGAQRDLDPGRPRRARPVFTLCGADRYPLYRADRHR